MRVHNLGAMAMRVCVVGSVNIDTVYSVDALPRPGETVLAAAARSTPGGKGGNQALAAARAGALVHFVGAVGDDDAGARLRGHLRENAVNTDGLVTVPGDSGRAVIVVDSAGENVIVVAPGANTKLTLDSPLLRRLVAGCEVLLLQLEIPLAVAAAAAREARSGGATVIVNASPASDDSDALAALAEVSDVVVVNEAEAKRWTWPVPHLVVTQGAAGARYSGEDGECTVAAPAVDAVDTSGAGDVFAGVLAASWTTGREHALRRACAAGALATGVVGAGDCAPLNAAIDDAIVSG
jgi:ribokinase